MSIKILLADDHEIIRKGLRSIIEKENDMEIIAETNNIIDVPGLIGSVKPDIVVVEIDKPGINSSEEIKRVVSMMPGIRLICMSMYATRIMSREIIKAGAMGYIVKHRAFEELIQAIRSVINGNVYVCE